MLAVFVNAVAVLLGGALGLLLHNKIKESVASTIVSALGLVTVVIGVMGAIRTNDLLCLIVCMAAGTAIGALLNIDGRIAALGGFLGSKLLRNNERYGKFADGFIEASLVFCVGAMTIVGSFKAGIEHDYGVIFAKSALDFVGAIVFAAGLGVGVPFAALFVLVFQGGLTAFAGAVSPFLSEAVVTELSAVGGAIVVGLGLNLLGQTKEKIKVADMTPAIFLPVVYVPLSAAIRNLVAG